MELIPEAGDEPVRAMRLARDARRYKDILERFTEALLDNYPKGSKMWMPGLATKYYKSEFIHTCDEDRYKFKLSRTTFVKAMRRMVSLVRPLFKHKGWRIRAEPCARTEPNSTWSFWLTFIPIKEAKEIKRKRKAMQQSKGGVADSDNDVSGWFNGTDIRGGASFS